MPGLLRAIASSRPMAKVVATDRMAKANVQMKTRTNGPRICGDVNSRS